MTTTMDRPLSFLGGLPSYIRVISSTLASLPEIKHFDVPLPSGEIARLLHEDNAVSRASIPQLQSVKAVVNNVDAQKVVNWSFRGLYFNDVNFHALWGPGSQQGDLTFYWGPRPGQPRGVIFNQCAFDADPLLTGNAKIMPLLANEGSYIGIFNSYITNYYGASGSEQILIVTSGEGPGPYEWSNNEIRIPGTFYNWSGGAQHTSVGNIPTNWITERNWIYWPMSWRQSELNPRSVTKVSSPGYAVLVQANRLTVNRDTTYNQRGWAMGGLDGVGVGITMVDFATGVARRIVGGTGTNSTYDVNGPVTLEAPWPGTSTARLRVFFQHTDLVLYNSGWDTPGLTALDGPTATTHYLGDATRVGFSAPLPPQVKSREDNGGGDNPGHFFYLNNTEPAGGQTVSGGANQTGTNDGLGGLATFPRRNDWTWESGMTYATSRRKEILSIAPDRLSCTLTHPGSAVASAYFEASTFTYSVVWGDGLIRDATQFSKGEWEFKTGRRMLHQGNVLEAWRGTQHPTNQTFGGGAPAQGQPPFFTGTITGDVFRITAVGTRDMSGNGYPEFAASRAMGDQMDHGGHPWPYKLLVPTANYTQEYWTAGRVIKRIHADGLGADLYPPEPNYEAGSQPTSLTNVPFGGATIWGPSARIEHTVFRYNMFVNGGTFSTFTGNENPGETQKGYGARTHHDNIYIETGKRYQGMGLERFFNIPTTNFTARPGLGRVPNDNGNISFTHNGFVRMIQRPGNSVMFNIDASAAGSLYEKSRDIDISANVFHDLSEATSMLGIEAYAVRDTRIPWEEAFYQRNVLVGSQAQAAIASQLASDGGRFPDNAGVPTGGAGFADINHADRYRLDNYRLTDIFTTGTVAIDATGLLVTLEGGVQLPVALGQGGPFFKTSTSSVLSQILPPSQGLRSTWSSVTGGFSPLTQSGGRMVLTATSVWSAMRHAQVLPTSQWAEATVGNIPGATRIGVAVCMNATGSMWMLLYAKPGSVTAHLDLYRWSNGVVANGGSPIWSSPAGVNTGMTIRLEVDTTNVYVYGNNVLQNPPTSSTALVGGSAGAAGISISGSTANLYVDDWSCGSGTTAAGNRVTLAQDDFAPQQLTTQFVLKDPYPETNVTGKSYAITFKNSAPDGRDPGPDFDTLTLMTRGVKKRPT